jgi:hypothetical protein
MPQVFSGQSLTNATAIGPGTAITVGDNSDVGGLFSWSGNGNHPTEITLILSLEGSIDGTTWASFDTESSPLLSDSGARFFGGGGGPHVNHLRVNIIQNTYNATVNAWVSARPLA